MASEFRVPMRYIFDKADLEAFQASPVFADLIKFVAAICHSIRDKDNDVACTISPVLHKLLGILEELKGWVKEIPPLQQPMRYGNKAYRLWHNKLVTKASELCKQLLEADSHQEGAEVELAAYLYDSFGNATRIDYGTGHETTFVIFLYCLAKLKLLSPEDLVAVGTKVIPAYLSVCRTLQRAYWSTYDYAEPAGSHGVWSLDDYQFLAFVFGSAQLIDHKHIKPKSIHNREIMEAYESKFMYLSAIQFIKDVKSSAPFEEHSPILHDLSSQLSWGRVHEELAGMYRAEVLCKLPVVQHFVFGSLFAASWTPSRTPVPSEAIAHAIALTSTDRSLAEGAELLASAVAAETVPVDDPSRAVAPWVTEPLGPDPTGAAPWAK